MSLRELIENPITNSVTNNSIHHQGLFSLDFSPTSVSTAGPPLSKSLPANCRHQAPELPRTAPCRDLCQVPNQPQDSSFLTASVGMEGTYFQRPDGWTNLSTKANLVFLQLSNTSNTMSIKDKT